MLDIKTITMGVDVENSEGACPASPLTFTIDESAEKRLLRKLDVAIYPILYIVYMMSFLDWINIGNAKIQGMAIDLDLTGSWYNIALFVSPQTTCNL